MKKIKNISNPLISAIVVTYNSSEYVVETLESIKDQTYSNIELIVTDDCSQDDTVQICKEWIHENKERFVSTKVITSPNNTGIAPNANRGWKVAKGDWLFGIAGDDALFPYTFKKYMVFAKNNPDIEFIHSNVAKYKNEFLEENRLEEVKSSEFRINQPDITTREQFEILLRISNIWAATTIEKRTVFEKLGGFDERYPMWEDTPHLIKLTKNNVKLHYLDIIGAKYRIRQDSVQKKRKGANFFTDLALQRDRARLEKQIRYFPFLERMLRKYHYGRSLVFNQLGLNKNNILVKILFVLSGYISKRLINQINSDYR